jgi:glycosyltransferase involved in cell wall biosynthesis
LKHKPTLLHVFPTFAVGGAQTRFTALANHLGREARHLIVAIDGRTDAREKLRPGLDVSYLPPPPANRGVRHAIAHARAVIAETRPDILITSNWGSIDWAVARLTLAPFRSGGVPHLHMEDGFGPEEQDAQLPRRVLTRRMVLRFSQVMLPSRTLLKIATDIWRLPAARLHYIPNGIDIARFANATPFEPPGGEGPVIGTIAALRPEKNVMRLLEAVALLRAQRPVRLVIVGDGPRRPVLQQRTQELGLEHAVHFAGHSAEPERWMAAFDVFALSSDTEQMPLSVLEAMAASRPIVATNVGDVGHMLAAENLPYLVPRDSAALSNALGTMLDDPMAAMIGAANGKKAAATYSDAAMFSAFRGIIGVADKERISF